MTDFVNILANNGLAIFLVIYWVFSLGKKFDKLNANIGSIKETIQVAILESYKQGEKIKNEIGKLNH